MPTALEQKLGYSFRDERLILTALTHPSYGGDHRAPHYQRLEFLGDAVLELAISKYLYAELPDVDEGKLTRLRAELVREETLCKVARELDLGRYVKLSVGEERSGGREKPSILSDVAEAVIAAVYLDGGIDAAIAVVMRAYAGLLTPDKLSDNLDAKTKLQEALQSVGLMPEYELLSKQGPPHAPIFRYRVLINGANAGEGEGRSKQSAQQQAARAALKKIGENNANWS